MHVARQQKIVGIPNLRVALPLFPTVGILDTRRNSGAGAKSSPGLFDGFVPMQKRHFCPIHQSYTPVRALCQ